MLVEDTYGRHPHTVLIEYLDGHAGEREVRVQVVVELDQRGDRIQGRDTRDLCRSRVRLQHRDVREERIGRVDQAPPRALDLRRVDDVVPIPVFESG